ncbi:unnamed protein product, partial [Vitis vinifera]
MGKNEFLTPKAIANRIKAKGLQKLRWYCQMCQKQCRDENGFKCHCMSESHQRQMQVFGQNPNRIIDGYSEEFEREFLEHMKRSHRFSRVAATVVYNEYIADRHHIHMNSTEWATLTEFVKYLGRTGKCKVEETPKGWFITYIDRDSETLFKERLKNKRMRADMLVSLKSENGGKIAFALGSSKLIVKEKVESSKLVFEDGESENIVKGKGAGGSGIGGVSALDELMREQEKVKERNNRKDYWLCEGIVHVLRVDQEELETVIPQIGGLLRIKGIYDGRVLQAVEYEDICKVGQ